MPKESVKDNARKWKSIEDIVSLDEIDHLSVKDLKKILTVNFVDYKGCFEKKELIERVKRLWSSQNSGGSLSFFGIQNGCVLPFQIQDFSFALCIY